MDAFLLEPYIAPAVWGGHRLIDLWGMHTDKENAAEAWVLSGIRGQESTVRAGRFSGRRLSEVLGAHPEYLGCFAGKKDEGSLPVLVKLIDARQDLSVQVHPTAEYCAKTGGARPKTECWLILDCEENARLAMGFKEDVTAERVSRSLKDGSFMELVNYVRVRPGDFFFIPAGTLHAIGKGILLAEVQQSSDTTYRLYDYDRPGLNGKMRPLHIEEALAVLNFKKNDADIIRSEGKEALLCSCDEFTVSRVRVSGTKSLEPKEYFRALLVLKGTGTLSQSGEKLKLSKGACAFIPAGDKGYSLAGDMDVLVIEP
jgi:mannose-6-phosphate isomerase